MVEFEKGKWRLIGSMVVIRCPSCEKDMSVSNHAISADGTLNPSVVCPNQASDSAVAVPGFRTRESCVAAVQFVKTRDATADAYCVEVR